MSNALLQGGLISKLTQNEKGYALDKDHIYRTNMLYDVGLVFGYKNFSLSITQKLHTAEFEGQKAQEIGNITFQFKL